MITLNQKTHSYRVSEYLLKHLHLLEDFNTMTDVRNHLRKVLDMPKLDDATVAPIVHALILATK